MDRGFDEQCDVSFALGKQLTHHDVEMIKVFLIELWELTHKWGEKELFPNAVVEEFVEQHAGDHVQRFKDAFAFRCRCFEGRNLDLTIV